MQTQVNTEVLKAKMESACAAADREYGSGAWRGSVGLYEGYQGYDTSRYSGKLGRVLTAACKAIRDYEWAQRIIL